MTALSGLMSVSSSGRFHPKRPFLPMGRVVALLAACQSGCWPSSGRWVRVPSLSMSWRRPQARPMSVAAVTVTVTPAWARSGRSAVAGLCPSMTSAAVCSQTLSMRLTAHMVPSWLVSLYSASSMWAVLSSYRMHAPMVRRVRWGFMSMPKLMTPPGRRRSMVASSHWRRSMAWLRACSSQMPRASRRKSSPVRFSHRLAMDSSLVWDG